jgi:hypothetical protein
MNIELSEIKFENNEVYDAILMINNLTSDVGYWEAYDLFLSQVSNDHNGSYFPDAELALPVLLTIVLESPNDVPSQCALEILIDLYSSFWPCRDAFNVTNIDDYRPIKIRCNNVISGKEMELISLSVNTKSAKTRKLVLELVDMFSEPEWSEI